MVNKILEKTIMLTGKTRKEILKKIAPFCRVLNRNITDEGTQYNREDRIVYRRIRYAGLKGIKPGDSFRMVNYACSSSCSDKTNFGEYILKIKVKCDCFNAGQINKFGVSCFENEEETLIPPYSFFTCEKIEGKHWTLSLAQDNKAHPVEMKVTDG